MSTQTPIVILGLAGLSMAHGALGVLRSAGRLGIEVFLAHPQRHSLLERQQHSPLECSRYSSGSLCLPHKPPEVAAEGAADGHAGHAERVLEALLEFGASRRRPVLLAVDDAAALFVDDHAERLREAFLFPSQPPGLARALADKRHMQLLCDEHGMPTPRAAFPQSGEQVSEYAEHARFPIVAKRIDASLAAGSATPNVLVAEDRSELREAYARMEPTGGANVMLQEYIPAGEHANWMFNGYFDVRSESRLAATGMKLRQAPPRAGAASLGVCRPNERLAQATIEFLQALSYRGIVDIDYRLDSRDGQYKLLDVNPRIGASFRLFVGEDGSDVLRAMYFDLTGQASDPAGQVSDPAGQASPAPDGTARAGRRWLVEPQDLRSSLHDLRCSELTVRGWLRSLRGVRETAWWARDDPRPFGALVGSLLRGRLRRWLGGKR